MMQEWMGASMWSWVAIAAGLSIGVAAAAIIMGQVMRPEAGRLSWPVAMIFMSMGLGEWAASLGSGSEVRDFALAGLGVLGLVGLAAAAMVGAVRRGAHAARG